MKHFVAGAAIVLLALSGVNAKAPGKWIKLAPFPDPSVELYGGAQSESARTGRSGGAQTFKGSCQFNGNVSFDPPLGAVSRETTVTAKAPGHCSGSLTGASGRTVELDQAPARYSAVSLGPQSCGLDPESD